MPQAALKRLAPQDVELRYRAADGTYRWFLSRLAPVVEEGRVVRLVGAAMDLSARREMEEALRHADRRKDEFLGMLSHELRNPLAPIRSATWVLRHAEGTEQARRARDVIERQTEHLTRLVDDLLDVTRIARGKIELRRARLDLCDLVRRTAEDLRSELEDRRIAFRVSLPDEGLVAEVDATRIAQVIGNLLHNAAKFTSAGDAVSLALRRAGDCAELEVTDTGAGIAADLLPRVFEPFVQGEGSLARTQGGLGLGLALVKGIAELHGGTVRAESGGDRRGATLTVRLPLAPEGVPDRPVRSARRTGGGRRVLVVDDNRDAADTLAQLVELLGHDVEVAYDGPSALAKVRERAPDVVLCDLGLPGMDGYDVARQIRAGSGGRVRLVAVSGYAQPEDVARATAAGFDVHVPKPADPERIDEVLR